MIFRSVSDFVELRSGPITAHQFKEAIDGVFRQEKYNKRKEQASSKKTTEKQVPTKQIDNGQQSIDIYCTKRSTGASERKEKTMVAEITSQASKKMPCTASCLARKRHFVHHVWSGLEFLSVRTSPCHQKRHIYPSGLVDVF